MGIAELHPEKREKFWAVYNTIKEEHYPALHLKKNIPNQLHTPQQSIDLAKFFKRSSARISEELIDLKKEGKAFSYRVGSRAYWMGDNNIAIISRVKCKYLDILRTKNPLTAEFAKELNVCWKSSNRRLMELKKLQLADKYKNGRWHLTGGRKVMVI